MSDEVTYDAAAQAEVIKGHPRDNVSDAPVLQDGLGCHSGSEMVKAARLSGNSELLDQFARCSTNCSKIAELPADQQMTEFAPTTTVVALV